MLEARDVTLVLGGRRVLDAVSIAASPGEILVLAGPNGAGKSSLLSVLTGAVTASSGSVLIDGAPLAGQSPHLLARRRAVLEQSPTSHPDFTLREVVELSIPREISPNDAGAIIGRAINALGLQRLADRRLGVLSGGERHRAHMARALAQLESGRALGHGEWLLLDEPTASLDPRHQGSVLSAARNAAAAGAGVLVVLHDLTLAAQMADRIALMRNGRLVAVGRPDDVLTPERLLDVYEIPMVVTEPKDGRRAIVPLFM